LKTTNDAGFMTRPAWILMHELAPFKDCPRMDLTAEQSLTQRLINIPSSSGLVTAAP
jgi:perosamine synthetase